MSWLNWFSRSKKEEQVIQRLEKLEKLIETLSEKETIYHINVEKIDVHDLKLENLTFSLDKLDIKDLSGALNLGNNLGVRVNQEDQLDKDKVKFKKDHLVKKKQADQIIKPNQKGYTFTIKPDIKEK
ncbi:hypothetical protein JCM9157_4643 [Halalkalibacter akibai JCM 9157]|uniref:Uncharacterized protein n=1 Tax=Halalkalibacter akibai (strain ATCC 43226 / DSM 21942 / CIP 109018 / JCM 9157 / 1139) TaxID=1236973 RepID=W4R0D2_HALA3|nr:hypothetical protein JCM9157_4643 [Halalkalibacter akibai JCM 9157]